MSDEFGNDLITITDQDGNAYSLEHVDTIELDDTYYLAFVPADMSEEDDDFGLVILKVVEEDGEEILATIDDDEYLEELYSKFLERLEQ